MSGPPRLLADDDDPALDPGVIVDRPLVEWNGWQAVLRHGGTAVLHWRSDFLTACAAGVTASSSGQLPAGSIDQALVRIQKGRDATWSDLMWSWHALADGGRLLVTGANDLGIATWAKRLAARFDQPGEVLANHSRSRVVLFHRRGQSSSEWPCGVINVTLRAPTPLDPSPPCIEVPPGVFSRSTLDGGTALLASYLEQVAPAERVLDLGCGGGHLGLNALLRWPQAHAWFVDADVRAIEAVRANLGGELRAFHLHERATVTWWDVSEALPATEFDLILANPPCHSGTAIDLTTARAMFRTAVAALAPEGCLLVVANRQLPYEADLAALGQLEVMTQQGGFKLLSLRRW